jgi:hypothetical protein
MRRFWGQVHPTEHSSALSHELAEVQILQGDIWGITSYFNPEGYQSKLDNFRLFRKRITTLQGLPLVVVELTFGDKCDLPPLLPITVLVKHGTDVPALQQHASLGMEEAHASHQRWGGGSVHAGRSHW